VLKPQLHRSDGCGLEVVRPKPGLSAPHPGYKA